MEVSCGPVFSWSFRHSIDKIPKQSRTCHPNIIHNLIPPLFVHETKGPQKPILWPLFCWVSIFWILRTWKPPSPEKDLPSWFQKKRLRTFIATFHHLLLQPAIFHHLQVGFKVLSKKKKGSPPVFQPSAPLQPAGFFVSPTTPQDQDSGLKLKMFACGGSTDVLLGWPVGGWT